MTNRVAKFLRLPARRRRLLLASITLTAALCPLLWLLPLRAVVRLADRLPSATNHPRANDLADVGWAAATAANLLGGRCLHCSLTAKVLVQRQGLEATLRIGLDPTGGFHAWVEHDGTPITDYHPDLVPVAEVAA